MANLWMAIEAAAKHSPVRVALQVNTSSITYQELREKDSAYIRIFHLIERSRNANNGNVEIGKGSHVSSCSQMALAHY